MAIKRDDEKPNLEEQLMRRQSAPRPTAEDYVNNKINQQEMMNTAMDNEQVINGRAALTQPIGREQVQKATNILMKYKEGKANLERKIVENEQWYKLRHWECLQSKEHRQVQPSSGWLFNCIANKHADAMDNFPSPNILPREEGDKAEAEMLSSIVPVVLEENDFEEVYDRVWNYKLKTGTGVYGVFWDSSKMNGLGDIAIRKIDILNLFWESGITDIQKSRNIFNVELADNDMLIQRYPQLQGKLGTSTIETAKYNYDDSVDTSNKSAVIDWYYKRQNSAGKTVLHYVKYVNDEVLFATENEPELAERGWYDHGKYPFIFDPLFTIEGTPTGFGYIDVGKNAQEYIDRGSQSILENMLANTRPRHFIRSDGSVNEEEYADITKDFVHVDSNLGQDSILPIQGKPLNDIYVTVINNKIDELKEVTGNRDIQTGGTTSGVTAASAIAAMQEAGSKLSRDAIKASYRVFRELCMHVIELIRQFYNEPRKFRIIGERGMYQYITYSNEGIQPQDQGGMEFGIDMGFRIPVFDIEVTAQKQSPYSKMSQNELALQFYGLGFFNPQMSDQALLCLEMMDFDRKEQLMQKIAQNGTMYQMLMQMQQQMLALGQMVDKAHGSDEVTQGLMQQFGMQMPTAEGQDARVPQNDSLGNPEGQEAPVTKKARQRVAESTSPT